MAPRKRLALFSRTLSLEFRRTIWGSPKSRRKSAEFPISRQCVVLSPAGWQSTPNPKFDSGTRAARRAPISDATAEFPTAGTFDQSDAIRKIGGWLEHAFQALIGAPVNGDLPHQIGEALKADSRVPGT